MSGSLKNLLDRTYDIRSDFKVQGKDVYFIMQGAAPTPESIAQLKWTLNRFGQYFNMNVQGLAANEAELAPLRAKIQNK